jgi:hypothetical protein
MGWFAGGSGFSSFFNPDITTITNPRGPGFIGLATGAQTASTSNFQRVGRSGAVSSFMNLANGPITIAFGLQYPVVPDVTNNYFFQFGLIDNTTTRQNGFFYRMISVGGTPSHQLRTILSGTETTVTSTQSVVANSWYAARVEYTNTLVSLYLNGVLTATSSTNIATNSSVLMLGEVTKTGTGALSRQVNFDWYYEAQTLIPSLRWTY